MGYLGASLDNAEFPAWQHRGFSGYAWSERIQEVDVDRLVCEVVNHPCAEDKKAYLRITDDQLGEIFIKIFPQWFRGKSS